MSLEKEQFHIGHYVLGRTIGNGGFAKVKEGRHNLTGSRVAVKIINKSLMKNINMISKVKREIKILKFINHPHIIKLYEVLDTTTDIFVVMEMAEHGELYNYIQHNDFTEQQALGFFSQIIQGVEAAHLHLVAHRDLKPENILLGPNYTVKIADFGLSNLMKDGKFLKTSCGSLNYAAPEIIRHRPYQGTSVDVWSCGVILYTMLVGALPFDEEVLSVLYRKIQKADFEIPSFVSPLAGDLLTRMITANPLDRIKIKDIKNHPWFRHTLPLYARLISFAPTIPELPFELDPQILSTLRYYKMESMANFKDLERMKKVLQRRTDDSFVIAYHLLRYQKEQRELVKQQQVIQTPNLLIFKQLPNKLLKKKVQPDQSFKYGHTYAKSPKVIIATVLAIFKRWEVEYTLKNNEYCVLCSYYSLPSTLKKKDSSRIQEMAYGTQGEERFRKDQLHFILQLYSMHKIQDILVDLKLVQGHPITFIVFSKRLYKEIWATLPV